MKIDKNSTGRLKQLLDEKAHAIVFPTKEKLTLVKEFDLLATLNEAHLIALHKSKSMPPLSVKKLLMLIADLREQKFAPLLNKIAKRGSYLLFENYLTEKLGIEIAGSLHIGRSRNDINATIFKWNIRDFYKTIFNNLCTLRATLLKKANQHKDMAMPVYSQFQVAQVGTYAYYLIAFEEAFARDQHFFKELIFSINECPMGAAAGCGTSFPIDYKLISSILGFSRSSNNALDAVADRDVALRILSTLSIIGMHLGRIAQNYQLWTTQEFSFFDLSDDLCGSSSMMPQKKNPYLFEAIKGKVASLNGMLVQVLTAMHNVPFANSFEVGTQALQGLDNVLMGMCDILVLADLLIGRASPIPANMSHSISKGVAIATGVAEMLVKTRNIPFRQAHYEIGSKINIAISSQLDPANELLKMVPTLPVEYYNINWAHLNEYGGGPGKKATQNAYRNARQRLQKDIRWIKLTEKKMDICSKKASV